MDRTRWIFWFARDLLDIVEDMQKINGLSQFLQLFKRSKTNKQTNKKPDFLVNNGFCLKKRKEKKKCTSVCLLNTKFRSDLKFVIEF